MNPLYLDYAATTPVDPRVAETIMRYLTPEGVFGNPASLHLFGQAAHQAVEEARACIASFIHAESSEIVFTSGATESNNLALKGAAFLYQRKGKHIVTMKTEHKSVLDTCHQLEKEGYTVTYLKPLSNGLLDLNVFQEALRPDTCLVSIMHVNNELGVIQDIATMAEFTSQRGILFHVDAAQSAGKIPIDVNRMPVDLLSLCAHKMYGPKGIGALYLRKKPRVRVAAQIHGGGQEQSMRAGTLATHQIVGFGEASRIAALEMGKEAARIQCVRDALVKKIKDIPGSILNTDIRVSVPHILNVRLPGLSASDLLIQYAVSAGSTCQSLSERGSYVLRALGQRDEEAELGIRFSFGRWTELKEVEKINF